MGAVVELHEELLDHARELVAAGVERPRQAELRRAVSAAYYSLFHLLIADGAKVMLGTHSDDHRLRSVLSRVFVHGEMARASKAFAEGASAFPRVLRGLFEGATLPSDLLEVADGFVRLQSHRHRADYDVSANFDSDEVAKALETAELSAAAWKRIRGTPAARVYLHALLLWNRLPKE